MPRAPGVVQFQSVMPPALRDALDRAAIDLRDPEGETAGLDRGRMARGLFLWFLERPIEEQLDIVLAGLEIYEAKYGKDTQPEKRPQRRGGSVADLGDPTKNAKRAPDRDDKPPKRRGNP